MIKKIPLDLQKIIFHDKKKKTSLFLSVFLFNTFASLFEGVSFSFMFLALSVLNRNNMGEAFSIFPSRITSLFSSFTPNRLFTFFLLSAIFLQILRSLFSYGSRLLLTFQAAKMQSAIQKGIYERIFRLSYCCVNNYKIGDLEEYTKGPSVFVMPFFDALNQLLVTFLLSVVLIFVMSLISIKLTFFVLSLIGLGALCQRYIIKKVAINSEKQTNSIVEQSKESVQSLYGIKAVFAFNRQKQILKNLSENISKTASATLKLYFWNYLVIPFHEITSVLMVGITLLLGIALLDAGQLPLLATLVTFLTLTYRLANRLNVIVSALTSVAHNYGGLLRCIEIWDDSRKEFRKEGGERCLSFYEQIVFDNVFLKYETKKEFALQNISCSIPKGKTIAFVGASGAGKSSLLDLLVRLYEPTQGKIYVDGKDLSSYELESWLKKLGVVCQDTIIFNESVEDNIRFGLANIPQKAIEKAAMTAYAHEFIHNLPHGYQTIVGEKGFRLSGGERQRIALARALLRGPEILIMDEATSNLDSQSEKLIQEALNNLHGKKTILIVAHRLATIRNADVVFVLDRGKIIEHGTHQDLLQMRGKYHHYWNLQTEIDLSLLLSKKMPNYN